MKYFGYIILGGIIGLVVGAFFGFVFDSFYTKKSESATKAQIQAMVFGVLGAVVGMYIGFKIAEEEREKKRNAKEYQESLVDRKCERCKGTFTYSTLEYAEKNVCDNCYTSMYLRYKESLIAVRKLMEGIEKMVSKPAIKKRFEKAKEVISPCLDFEKYDLDFLTMKPSDIMNTIEEKLREL